jgi:hypothetical protein
LTRRDSTEPQERLTPSGRKTHPEGVFIRAG